MSIPLIQDNQKDSINASLIAIKREEERLQALIAEADKKREEERLQALIAEADIKREEERLQALIAEADKKIAQLNELKVNKSDIVDEVTLNNMQSVTSNAVAQEIQSVTNYSTEETVCGVYDNKPLYRRIFVYTNVTGVIGQGAILDDNFPIPYSKILKMEGYAIGSDLNISGFTFYVASSTLYFYQLISSRTYNAIGVIVYYSK